MTKTLTRFAAVALSAIISFAIIAGMNSVATAQYSRADSLAMAPYGQTHVAMQHVTVVGHRATA